MSEVRQPDPTSSPPSSAEVFLHDRLSLAVSLSLLAAAAAAWVAVYYGIPGMNVMMPTMGVASIVSSLSVSTVALFEFSWTVGMVAMMFPAMIPVVLFYNRFVAKADIDPPISRLLGTPSFLLGYLFVYAGLGIAAYVGVYAALQVPLVAPSLAGLDVIAPGGVLILAGVYQLSPLKDACLSRCVSPLGFFTIHNHRGVAGALRMGVSHGAYCVGCCWAYMLVMLVIGLMSLPAMLILAAVIALEKVIVRGHVLFTRGVAAGFVTVGVAGLVFPALLMALPF